MYTRSFPYPIISSSASPRNRNPSKSIWCLFSQEGEKTSDWIADDSPFLLDDGRILRPNPKSEWCGRKWQGVSSQVPEVPAFILQISTNHLLSGRCSENEPHPLLTAIRCTGFRWLSGWPACSSLSYVTSNIFHTRHSPWEVRLILTKMKG